MTLKNTGSCENTEEGADTIWGEGRIVKNFFFITAVIKRKKGVFKGNHGNINMVGRENIISNAKKQMRT